MQAASRQRGNDRGAWDFAGVRVLWRVRGALWVVGPDEVAIVAIDRLDECGLIVHGRSRPRCRRARPGCLPPAAHGLSRRSPRLQHRLDAGDDQLMHPLEYGDVGRAATTAWKFNTASKNFPRLRLAPHLHHRVTHHRDVGTGGTLEGGLGEPGNSRYRRASKRSRDAGWTAGTTGPVPGADLRWRIGDGDTAARPRAHRHQVAVRRDPARSRSSPWG